MHEPDNPHFQSFWNKLTLKCPRGGRWVPNISVFFLRFLWNATDLGDTFFCNRLTCNSASFGKKSKWTPLISINWGRTTKFVLTIKSSQSNIFTIWFQIFVSIDNLLIWAKFRQKTLWRKWFFKFWGIVQWREAKIFKWPPFWNGKTF